MADDFNNAPEREKDELLKIFEQGERSYFTRLVDMCKGLGKPKDSLEFKQAMIEFQRLGAPIAAVVVIVSAITVMSLVKFVPDEKPPVVETQIIEPEPAEELVKEEPPPPEEPPELDEVVETDVVVDIDAPPTTSAEQSPQPSPVDAVALTPSPVVIKGVMGSRNPGLRGAAIGRYGAASTEKLVYGFLRWLKMKQGYNGLWEDDAGLTSLALLCYLAHGELPGQSEEFGPTVEKAIRAMIADQITTEEEAKQDHSNSKRGYDGHNFRRGEVGYFKSRNATNYTQLVAVYALSEAYAMTRIPDLKPVVERALKPIIDGQNANGGWYYNLDAKCPITDTSFASWAVQALKAAKLAHIGDQKLKGQIVTALKKASKGIKTCLHNDGAQAGAFGYLDKMPEKNSYWGLTAPCVLILQMLDEGDTPLAQKSLKYMETWDPTFKCTDAPPKKEKNPAIGKSSQYYCYYLSQVRFNQGEKHPAWLRWNETQKRLYNAAAINIPADKSGYVDHNGKPQYITYWPVQNSSAQYKGEAKAISDEQRLTQDKGTKNGTRMGYPIKDLINRDVCTLAGWHSGKNPAMKGMLVGNCLTALQLMVYYRNSPLAKGALSKIEAETEVKVEDKKNEVVIEGIDDL